MAAKDPEKTDLVVTYPAGPAARRFHVDGAIGGPTPQGLFAVSFYAETFPLPPQSELAVSSDKETPGEERFPTPERKIQREIQTSIIMTLETARALHTWLGGKVEKFADRAKK